MRSIANVVCSCCWPASVVSVSTAPSVPDWSFAVDVPLQTARAGPTGRSASSTVARGALAETIWSVACAGSSCVQRNVAESPR